MSKSLSLISPESIPYVRPEKLQREVSTLESRKSMILRDKSRSKDSQATVLMLETEICYLQRELEIRERRRKAHDKFLQKRSERRAKRR